MDKKVNSLLYGMLHTFFYPSLQAMDKSVMDTWGVTWGRRRRRRRRRRIIAVLFQNILLVLVKALPGKKGKLYLSG